MSAVSLLGVTDGFMRNDNIRIALPGYLNDAAGWLKKLGQGKKVDELILGMNRAAENAVPMAKDMLVGAVKSMSVQYAKTILQGGRQGIEIGLGQTTRRVLGTLR